MGRIIDITSILEKKNFFQTEEFNSIMEAIKTQPKGVLGLSLEKKSQVIEGCTFEQWEKFCHSLYYNLSEQVVVEDDDEGYEWELLEYKGYQFKCLGGFGSPLFSCEKSKK